MRRDRVIGVHERFLRRLPVAAEDLDDMDGGVAFAEEILLKMLVQIAQIGVQRLAIGIHVDKDEAAPSGHLHFGQTEFSSIDLRKIPPAGNVLKLAVRVPGKAVIGATNFAKVAGSIDQVASHVQAGIVIAFDGIGRDAHEDDRNVIDLVNIGIAHLRDAFLPQCHLPDLRPDFSFLEFVKLWIDVAIDGDVMIAEKHRRVDAKVIGNRTRILIQKFLVRYAGTAANRRDAPIRLIALAHFAPSRDLAVAVFRSCTMIRPVSQMHSCGSHWRISPSSHAP